jgi:hypothetical protein
MDPTRGRKQMYILRQSLSLGDVRMKVIEILKTARPFITRMARIMPDTDKIPYDPRTDTLLPMAYAIHQMNSIYLYHVNVL